MMRKMILISLMVVAMLLVVGCTEVNQDVSGDIPTDSEVPDVSEEEDDNAELNLEEGEEAGEDIETELAEEDQEEEDKEDSALAGQAAGQPLITSPMLPLELDAQEYVRREYCRSSQCVNSGSRCKNRGLHSSSRYICDPYPGESDLLPGGSLPNDYNPWLDCREYDNGVTYTYKGNEYICENNRWRVNLDKGEQCASTRSWGFTIRKYLVWSYFFPGDEAKSETGERPRRTACCKRNQCATSGGSCRNPRVSGKWICDDNDWYKCKSSYLGTKHTFDGTEYECKRVNSRYKWEEVVPERRDDRLACPGECVANQAACSAGNQRALENSHCTGSTPICCIEQEADINCAECQRTTEDCGVRMWSYTGDDQSNLCRGDRQFPVCCVPPPGNLAFCDGECMQENQGCRGNQVRIESGTICTFSGNYPICCSNS